MTQRGFTLIEMLVYIAVLLTSTAALLIMLFSLDDLFLQYRANQILHANATTIMQRLTYDMRHAESAVGSVWASHPGRLELQRGATTTVYQMDGDELVVSVNGRQQGTLTDAAVSVPSAIYYHYDNGATELVRARLELMVEYEGFSKTRVFRTAAVMNGTYGD